MMRRLAGPLGIRNFRLLLGGQAVSTAGDMFYAVALPWLVLNGGGTARELSVVLAVYGVPRVGTVLLGGWLSDRLHPRRVMLLADVARMALVAILAWLAVAGLPPVWQLCLIAAPLGACEGLFLPASFAILPALVDEAQLPAGNAINGAVVQGANLIGPALGGAVVSLLHPSAAFAVDALTFGVSAASLWAMRAMPVAQGSVSQGAIATAPETQQTFWQLLRTWRLLQVALVIVIVGNLTIGGLMQVAIPALAHGPFHADAREYGAMLAAFGGGALLGGLAAGNMGKLPRQAVVILLLTLGQAVGILLLPFVGGLAGAYGVLVGIGLITGMTNVLYLTLIQRSAPKHLLGRIMGVLAFATLGLYPLSVALAGVIIGRWGPAAMFPLTGIAIATAVAFGLAQREVRQMA